MKSFRLSSQLGLLEQVDLYRLDASRKLDSERQVEMGQFLTPLPTARLMASMFNATSSNIRLLDAGTGAGSLFAATVEQLCDRQRKPTEISITAYEIDQLFLGYLPSTVQACQKACSSAHVHFSAQILAEDFVKAAVRIISGDLFSRPIPSFNLAILNPPYKKIRSESETRHLLRGVGIETSNLYTGFLALVVRLLDLGGELVAITPRSFCNGPYFKPFRKFFLEEMVLKRIHVFESRERAFREDQVLQENVILHAVKGEPKAKRVAIWSSTGPEDEYASISEMDYDDLVQPNDPDYFIHIVPDELNRQVAQKMTSLHTSLSQLGLSVSTGRVVDFRATRFLRQEPSKNDAPLIYPGHFREGYIQWPRQLRRKANALVVNRHTSNLLIPNSWYVLVKRFSAKEERRRITAAIFDPQRVPGLLVALENHLNYFHSDGNGLSEELAKGLAAFLNSTIVDTFFRQFSGHTQVNAADLRRLNYPTREQLEALGAKIGKKFPLQDELDRSMKEDLFSMPTKTTISDPIRAKKKIDEGMRVLKELGLPREQQNERSALTLLALLDLKPDTSWSEAKNPLCGITPMMDFFARHYGRKYAPNTRETVRRFTVHQFLDAALAVANPDKPSRPVNSPKAVYQIEPKVLALLCCFGSNKWEKELGQYLSSVETLKKRYAREREMQRIPIQVAPGKTISLSPGGQNPLIKKIIDEFCSRFTPEAKLLYVGGTDEKWAYFDEAPLRELGIETDSHGKMPDVVVYHHRKNWLVLIEAVTSHGPINPKRRKELETLFANSKVGLVFVTCFFNRAAMVRYLNDISWETEVWVADSPSHLIHFNGERFLGPF